jgi:tetratricopeptide (TPR) repeat protein
LTKSIFVVLFIFLGAAWTPAACGADFTAIDNLLSHGQARQALQALEQHETGTAPADDAILWRMARAQYMLARTSTTAEERKTHLQRAETLADRAIEVAPQDDEGYKWLAITLGAQAEDAVIKTQIRFSRRIKEAIDKAIACDPDDDISLLVLSRWHYKIASLGFWTRAVVRLIYGGLPDASFEQAEKLLLQAISQQDRITHRYSLAKVYYRMGRRKEALQQLHKALTLPVTFPEEAEDIEKARRKLQRWQ